MNCFSKCVLIIFLICPNLLMAQCPTKATLENNAAKTIPTDGTCDSPADDGLICAIDTDFIDLDGTLTVLSCTTFNLTSDDEIFSYGTIIVEAGATLNSDRGIRIRSGSSATFNGNVNITSGNLRVVGGATLTIGSTAVVDVENNLIIGNGNGNNSGTINLNGTLIAGNNVNLNGQGNLSGSGALTFTGNFNDNGGTLGGMLTGCTGSNDSCGDPTLPVELIAFLGNTEENLGNKLVWSTATEVNNAGFHIQKSNNGRDFQSIAFVKGNGTTDNIINYSFVDPIYLGDWYYRLKQVDYDGQFEYSPTIFINSGIDSQMNIFPNPVHNQLSISADSEKIFDLKLMNISGKNMLTISKQTISKIEDQINEILPQFEDGTYLIQLNNYVEVQTLLFVKN